MARVSSKAAHVELKEGGCLETRLNAKLQFLQMVASRGGIHILGVLGRATVVLFKNIPSQELEFYLKQDEKLP